MAIGVAVVVGDAGDRLVGTIKRNSCAREDRHGLEPESEWGLLTREHRDKVAGYIDSRGTGATVVEDGREHGLYRDSDGFFLGVSLIDHVTTDMKDAYKDEIFGPVLEVMRVETYDEALRLVNESCTAAAAIFTRDGGRRALPVRRAGGHGRLRRADPRARRLLLVRRMEGFAVRRQPHVQAEGICYTEEGRDQRWPILASSVDLRFPRTR